ncbi:hypothetical protein HN014_14620 [Aquimarina sp. TRL1]|uniref:DUF7000 family protein n=1 Tax=Aquimarina sp. (strain TRL1) TaxID=2736252 RepID=UPI00158ACAFF|nr:hypothetical protein [Aquimarina sp. TRL1]QKX06089.1 hypothetical protein HN014_14620 [Aquimarina sp. TRL1]
MKELQQHIAEYNKQMKLGSIPKTYQKLMKYLMGLRAYFIRQYANEFVIGSFYQGYMDISYFPITPKVLKAQQLKIGLIFNHEKMQFENWLVGQNKQVQKEYWLLCKEQQWDQYPLSSTAQNSIIKHPIIKNPDFEQLDILTKTIEKETLQFITAITNTFPNR